MQTVWRELWSDPWSEPFTFGSGSSTSVEVVPPENLAATGDSSNQITATWNATPNASGYNLYRDGVEIAVLGPTTSYVDTPLEPGRSYLYSVRARFGSTLSEYSMPVTAAPLSSPFTSEFTDEFA